MDIKRCLKLWDNLATYFAFTSLRQVDPTPSMELVTHDPEVVGISSVEDRGKRSKRIIDRYADDDLVPLDLDNPPFPTEMMVVLS